MGEKVEGAKNEGEKKAADAGKKVDDGGNTVVYKTDMHCEGCAKKIKRAVKNFPGVEQVKTDAGANKLTVTGKMDPAALKARLEEKIKKKVDIVSQPAKKEGGGGGGGDKKAEDKSEKPSEKKAEEKKPADKPKEKEAAAPKESTVPLKIRLHCEGCIQKMRSKILKFKGVSAVSFDMAKDLVTVVGTMDTKTLVPYLSERFKRPVDVIAPAKKDDGAAKKDDKKPAAGGGEKKERVAEKKEEKKEEKEEKKEAAPGGGGEKKEAAPGGGGSMVVNKMEYSGYPYAASTSYWYDPAHVYNHNKFVMEAQEHQAHVSQGYGNYAMPTEHYPAAPGMFSDENPNGCSVM
ncbi:heavy metal-associated isoprenylated plant protein 6-like [Argentina anserina]|uniref:heavy metal-associated isoprenylated plant protein 6-like n=1 Tax=Argentina anserina TaxID=57926 RepID=UPI0021762061|nr:heavy metal-associated isoprenylated plant protein 6-like [Potentilla anserina]